MGFLIQWLVYLIAFAAGSAVAYGIVSLMIRTKEAEPEPESQAEPELQSQAEPNPEAELDPEPAVAESSEIGAPG